MESMIVRDAVRSDQREGWLALGRGYDGEVMM